jgi:hypothetical protein
MQSLVVFGWLEKAALLPIYYLYIRTELDLAGKNAVEVYR